MPDDTADYNAPTVPPDEDPFPTPTTGAAEFADADKYLGRVVGGVKLDRLLGAGGMGAVFAGEHERLGKQVAIKILPKGLARERERAERFLREARAAAKLEHPNIVTVFDVGEEDDVWFISMRFVDGESAAGRVRRAGPLPVREVLRITRGVAAALDAAHRRNIVHRDVKPENVLLGDEEEVLLADFGLVRDLESGTQLSQSGQILGTPAYMSPEQARGEKVDHRSDLYSLGTTAYYLATGLPPFQAETAIATALKHIMDDAVPPSEQQPGVPRTFDAFVDALMAKQPDDRPASAAAIMDAIDQLLDGGLEAAPPARGPKVGLGILAGAGIGVVLLALLGAAMSGGGKRGRKSPKDDRSPAQPAAADRTGTKPTPTPAPAAKPAPKPAPAAGAAAKAAAAAAAEQAQAEERRLKNTLYARVAAFRRLVLRGGAGDELAAFEPPGAAALDRELVHALLRLTPSGIEWGGDPEIGRLTTDAKGRRHAGVILPFRRRAVPDAGTTGWTLEFIHHGGASGGDGEWYPRFGGADQMVKPAVLLLLDQLFDASPRERKRLLEAEMDASLQARGIKPGTPDYRRGHNTMVRGLQLFLAWMDRAETFEYGIESVSFDPSDRTAQAAVRFRTKMRNQPLKDSVSNFDFKLHHGRWLWWNAKTPNGKPPVREGWKRDGRRPGDGKGKGKGPRKEK
ncbi:MAG: serine/threonine-protein kinase [Planctomycetota bacterium]|jgi:serine/threonine-protein kinase